MGSTDPTKDQLTIQTGNLTLGGWLTSRVTRSLEQTPSTFEISLTEVSPNATQAIVVPGSTCTVMLGGELILTGYIDAYTPAYDGHTHNVMIAGRSNTEDIVDSSYFATASSDWWIQAGSLRQIVTKLLEPFPNVGLDFQGNDVTTIVPFNITPGETVWSILETLCRMTSKLIFDDEQGRIVIADIGTTRTASGLSEGYNVESAVAKIDWSHRFGKYMVINSAYTAGSLNTSIIATATDNNGGVGTPPRSTRTKLIILDADGGPNQDFYDKMVMWIANRAIGRSQIIQVTTTGWRDSAGNLYKPNTICNVSCPTLKVRADLVIVECRWERDSQGTRTVMTLMPPSALSVEPFLSPLGPGQLPANTSQAPANSPPLNPPT